MHLYDTSFTPPAPCLDVQVSSPQAPDHRMSLRGKVDTGADMCVRFIVTLNGKDLTFEMEDP